MKILIIDDENDFVSTLAHALARRSHQVVSAGSGEKGVEVFKEHSPDWVLLDYNLPGIDGKETLLRLKAVNPRVKVCFITGTDNAILRKEIETIGVARFLNKPIDIKDIFSLLA